jgi:hypothetical protein
MEGWDGSYETPQATSGPDYGCGSTYKPHDCYAWQRAHYVSTPLYTATVCGTCDKIIGFRWRNWKDRIWSLFSSEPNRPKTADKF